MKIGGIEKENVIKKGILVESVVEIEKKKKEEEIIREGVE